MVFYIPVTPISTQHPAAMLASHRTTPSLARSSMFAQHNAFQGSTRPPRAFSKAGSLPTSTTSRRSRSSPVPSTTPTAAAAAASSTDVVELKQQLRQSIEGLDRGIFGVQAAKRQEVAEIVSALEALNPTTNPTQHLDMVQGAWNLLYTTITITGVKKTKLGLREFVKLGDFQQIIDTQQQQALNVVYFKVAGLGLLSGNLSIKASYAVESEQRVSIKFIESTLVPDQLRQLFEKNYELLLSIFNPEGWLDITYVDSELRVGRDDKGNLFVLERAQGTAAAAATSDS